MSPAASIPYDQRVCHEGSIYMIRRGRGGSPAASIPYDQRVCHEGSIYMIRRRRGGSPAASIPGADEVAPHRATLGQGK